MKSLFKNIVENYSFLEKNIIFVENMGQSSFKILPSKFCVILLISNIFEVGETWRRI